MHSEIISRRVDGNVPMSNSPSNIFQNMLLGERFLQYCRALSMNRLRSKSIQYVPRVNAQTEGYAGVLGISQQLDQCFVFSTSRLRLGRESRPVVQ